MSRYVATTTTEDRERQTFVLEGNATIDEVFDLARLRERGYSTGGYLDRLAGGQRVYSLTISRDESVEPEKKKNMAELLGQETPQQQ
jgi:hypothetical protein